MLRSSSSVPTMSVASLAADGERRNHCSSLCHPAHRRSKRAFFCKSITCTASSLSAKPFLPVRRALSEADLQSLRGSTDEDRSTVEKTKQTSVSTPILNCSTGEEFLRSRSSSHRLRSTEVSTPCAYDLHSAAEVERWSPFPMASELGTSSKADTALASSVEEDFDGRGSNGSSRHGGSGAGPSGSCHGESDSTDLRYKKLLQSDPGNPLLLRNYAEFLSVTKHDYQKSEEYYELAILASPHDGEVLCMYAKHLWDMHEDKERAALYFDRAVEAAPDDCYVLAAHASFLWQIDKDGEAYEAAGAFPCTTALDNSLMASA